MTTQSFLFALSRRYCGDVEEATPEELMVSAAPGQKDTGKKWELIGMDKAHAKQSVLSKLTIVSLRGDAIGSAFSVEGEILAMCPKIRELDIPDTRISDWGLLGNITRELPTLTSLDVSENPHMEVRSPIPNSTLVPWATLMTVLPHLPQVQELHVEANNLSSPSSRHVFPSCCVICCVEYYCRLLFVTLYL